jgi:hypothetical protein
MNERIQQLADQCTVQEFSDCTGGFETFDKEKFARLIVRNNIQTLRGNGYDDAAQCLQDIHFGIEDPV